MADSYRKGAKVTWQWGSGQGEGTVQEKFEKRVQRTIKGEKIVRNGTEVNPAYLIETDKGDKVLKRGSELSGGR